MRLLWRLGGLDSPIVLMVHGFKAAPSSAFELKASSFDRLMTYLSDNGWHAMTQEELLKGRWERKSFYLTFDDIYDTVYTEAYPFLQRSQIPFTIFVTKDLVDKPGFITMEHLKALAADPLCLVGCHGIEHKMFRYFSPEEMTRQCEEERTWLEDALGVKVDSFAFPYGRIVEVSCKNRRQIKNMGFDVAFSAIEGTLRSRWFTGRHFLPRVNVSERFVNKMIDGGFPKYKDCEGR